MSSAARDHVDEIERCLAVYGHQAGGYHVLGPDPWRIIKDADEDGFMAFLEGPHALLAWRSPVAPPEHRDKLLHRLVAHADTVDKPLFVLLVDETTCMSGIRMGLTPTWVGTESFIELSRWSTSGGHRQKVRWARNHAASLGFEWGEVHPLTNSADHDQLLRVETTWKGERRERRTDSFQRTSFIELAERRRYFASSINGEAVAFCACTPINERSWYLQDVVRVPGAPRGALEGAMALALDVLRDEGYELASNGPIPFWRPNDVPDDAHSLGPIGNRLIRFFDRQYRFGGISQFRNKFAPDSTEPLYVLRNRRAIGPLAAISLARLLTKRCPHV